MRISLCLKLRYSAWLVKPPLPGSDAGGAADGIADLMGHRSLSSTKVYLHPDPARFAGGGRTRAEPPPGRRGSVMTAAVPRFAARQPVPDAGAVVARLAALTEPALLAEAGWDPAARVLSLPSGHPLLGWRACPSAGWGTRCTGVTSAAEPRRFVQLLRRPRFDALATGYSRVQGPSTPAPDLIQIWLSVPSTNT